VVGVPREQVFVASKLWNSDQGYDKALGAFDASPKRLNHPTISQIAKSMGKSPAQILLRWGLQHDFVVLPKSVTPARIQENAKLFDFSLDAPTMNRLDALEEGLATGWDPATQA